MIFIESTAVRTWTSVITLLLGFATGQVTDWVKDRRSHRRDSDARRETRDEARRERHNQFQRETLLSLQDAANELMRVHTETHSIDKAQNRQHGIHSIEPYPDGLDTASTQSYAKTGLLGVRVSDDVVRQMLQQMKNNWDAVFQRSKTHEEADTYMFAAWKDFDMLNQRVGEILREMDKVDLAAHGSSFYCPTRTGR